MRSGTRTTRPDSPETPGNRSLFSFRIERDRDLLSDADLARIVYRREGVRNWSKFVVLLDDETTFETVEANAETIIAAYEGSQSRVR